jgi:radical SAM protein with 4Fe4S-binding SPASM domain
MLRWLYVRFLCGNRDITRTAKPVALSIEPINSCNLRCPECLTGSNKLIRKKGTMRLDDFTKIIDEIYLDTCYLSLYFQGEPLLHQDFFRFVKYAKEKKIVVSTSTNGHFLDETSILSLISSKLDLLIISLDGASPESYKKYRKEGSFEKVTKGIEALVKKKKELKSKYPLIELQFIVFRHNEDEIKSFKKMAKRLQVDRATIKSAQLYSLCEDSEIQPPTRKKYSRYAYDNSGNLYLKKKKKKGCYRQWSQCVITIEGEMAPCCFDKEAAFSFGNVLNQGVYCVWGNDKNKLFRQNIQKKNFPSVCRQCPF